MSENLQVSQLDWDLKEPCADCPFLKSSPYHQGVANGLPSLMESVKSHTFAHTCHKTDCRPSCDGPKTWKGNPKHCAGALQMLIKSGEGADLQLPLLRAIDEKKLNIEDMTKRAKANKNVFTVKELLRFYLHQLKKQMERQSD